MERDAITVKLERRVRKLTHVNNVLVAKCRKTQLALVYAQLEVEAVREFMAETGLCPPCRRALLNAARVEAAA